MYAFALGFGLILLIRRSYPVLVLIITSLGICAYYALQYPPIGLALPIAAALFSAAEAGYLRDQHPRLGDLRGLGRLLSNRCWALNPYQPSDCADLRQPYVDQLGARDRAQLVVIAYETGVHDGRSRSRGHRPRTLDVDHDHLAAGHDHG